MLQARIPKPREIEPTGSEPDSLQQPFSLAFELLSRQYPLMLLTLILCVGIAGVYLLTAPKRYTGAAVLMIDRAIAKFW